jgi:hypothetical protein
MSDLAVMGFSERILLATAFSTQLAQFINGYPWRIFPLPQSDYYDSHLHNRLGNVEMPR